MTAQLLPFPKRGPLPPLSDRRTRVLLLAGSYHDACEGIEREHHRHGKPGSRLLVRSALWLEGSYADLERLLDELRSVNVGQYRAFWAQRVCGQTLEKAAERDASYHAAGWITKRMPPTIFVPTDISENAGYLQAEAKAFAKPKKRAS